LNFLTKNWKINKLGIIEIGKKMKKTTNEIKQEKQEIKNKTTGCNHVYKT
jgi:sulfur transfer protein SufE